MAKFGLLFFVAGNPDLRTNALLSSSEQAFQCAFLSHFHIFSFFNDLSFLYSKSFDNQIHCLISAKICRFVELNKHMQTCNCNNRIVVLSHIEQNRYFQLNSIGQYRLKTVFQFVEKTAHDRKVVGSNPVTDVLDCNGVKATQV